MTDETTDDLAELRAAADRAVAATKAGTPGGPATADPAPSYVDLDEFLAEAEHRSGIEIRWQGRSWRAPAEVPAKMALRMVRDLNEAGGDIGAVRLQIPPEEMEVTLRRVWGPMLDDLLDSGIGQVSLMGATMRVISANLQRLLEQAMEEAAGEGVGPTAPTSPTRSPTGV